MGIFLAFFVVVSLVCLILLIKIKLKQRRSQVSNSLSYKHVSAGSTSLFFFVVGFFYKSSSAGVESCDSSSAADGFLLCVDKNLSVEAYVEMHELELAFN